MTLQLMYGEHVINVAHLAKDLIIVHLVYSGHFMLTVYLVYKRCLVIVLVHLMCHVHLMMAVRLMYSST